MVVPLVIGAQVIASGIVLAFTTPPGEIDNASPETEGPSTTASVVFGVVLAALICILYSQFDSTTAMGAIAWACVRASHRVRQCGVILLWLRRLAMRALAYVGFLVKAWPFLALAVLWIGWILLVTLRHVSHKSPVPMADMVLGLGVLYMMFVLKKLYEDTKTSDEEIRRLEASRESLQQWRVRVEVTLTNAASAEESTSRRNAMDDAVDSAADVVKGFSTGVAKAALHSLLG